MSEFRETADNCRKSLSFPPISRNSREIGAKVHQFLMNKFINSSRFGDELLFISNIGGGRARARGGPAGEQRDRRDEGAAGAADGGADGQAGGRGRRSRPRGPGRALPAAQPAAQ